MELTNRALRFVELAEYLYNHNWIHFQPQDGGWPNEFEGEEKIYGIMMRILLSDNAKSKQQ